MEQFGAEQPSAEPAATGYRRREVRRGDDVLEAPTLDVHFPVAELFARAGLLPSEG